MSEFNKRERVEALKQYFLAAPNETILDEETVAAGINHTVSWMALKASTGFGIPYKTFGPQRLYSKEDALIWVQKKQEMNHEMTHFRI